MPSAIFNPGDEVRVIGKSIYAGEIGIYFRQDPVPASLGFWSYVITERHGKISVYDCFLELIDNEADYRSDLE